MMRFVETIFSNKKAVKENINKENPIKKINMLKKLAIDLKNVNSDKNTEILILKNNILEKKYGLEPFTLEEQYLYLKKNYDLLFANYNKLIKTLTNMDEVLFQLNQKVKSQLEKKLVNSIEITVSNYKDIFQEHLATIVDRKARITTGYEGEQRVINILRKHNNFKIISNLTLNHRGMKAQSDVVVITNKGIFVIEIKNYAEKGQYSIKIDNTGLWTKKYKNTIVKMNSVTAQNETHIAVINSILKEHFLENIFAKSLIVIPNDNVTIVNESIETVIRPDFIYNHIINSSEYISDEKVDAIYSLLLSKSLKEKKYSELNLNEEATDEMVKYINKYANLLNYLAAKYE